MHHLFEVTDEGQHREHRLNQHAVVPLAAATELEILGITRSRMEAGVAEDEHLLFELAHQRLESVVSDVGGIAIPGHHEAERVQD